MNKLLKITTLFTLVILLLFATTLLFDLKVVQAHISRKLIVWLLLLLELAISVLTIREEIKK